MNPLRIALPLLFATAVLGHGYGGSRGYSGGYSQSQDCGGTCGGGCGYGNPCNSAPAPIIEPSGCATGECGGGGYSRHSSGHSSQSGYHKSSTTITKETRNDELKIVVGKPVVNVRTTYIEPQPVIRKTTYIQAPAPEPVIYHKKQRYVDEGDYSGSGCAGGCSGGGSKIVKIIKKTTYASGDGGHCSTCGSESYSGGGDLEYSEQPTVVRKVTRIVTQPVVTRVIKTVVNQEPSGEYYDSGSSYSGHRGHHGGGGGHGGYGRQKNYGGGGAKAGAFAYASASASAGAGSVGGSQGGDYNSGGGCKSGCDEWKK